jgi:phosphatidylserine decarboxylase
MSTLVVISFGKKVFRTRVIRHSLNPLCDEKLLFHVRAYESDFKVQLSGNDYVGDAEFMVADLMTDAPQRDENAGLYGEEAGGGYGMKEFRVPCGGRRNIILLLPSGEFPSTKTQVWLSTCIGSTKYQPYDALHHQFYSHYLKQYDTNDTGTLSHIELTSILDPLGSTLSTETVNSFPRHGKKPIEDELTVDEALIGVSRCRSDGLRMGKRELLPLRKGGRSLI